MTEPGVERTVAVPWVRFPAVVMENAFHDRPAHAETFRHRNGEPLGRDSIPCGQIMEIMLLAALHKLRSWYWARHYKAGKTLTRFIAPDVRRDVEVVDASRAAAGVLTVRTRTWNVLYAIKGLEPQPTFGDVREVAIRDLWKCSGKSWGGPVSALTDRAA